MGSNRIRFWTVVDYQQQLKTLAMELSLAEERERHHLIEVLHDGIGQHLYAIKMMLASLKPQGASGTRHRLFDKILKLFDNTIEETRTLTFELCPPILYELGLSAAIDWLVRQYDKPEKTTIRHDSKITEELLNDPVRGLTYRAIRELLLNTEKHADADEVTISSYNQDHEILIEVSDNGKGFDPGILQGEEGKYPGYGLFNIKERLEQLGGRIQVVSAPMKGTTVSLLIPHPRSQREKRERHDCEGAAD